MTIFFEFKNVKCKKLSTTLFLILLFQALFVISTIPIVSGWIFWKYRTDGTVVSVGVSADGNYTVAGTETGSVFLFDGNGGLLWTYNFSVDVECVAISGDGSRIAVGIHEYRSGSPDIYLFDNLGSIIWHKDLVEGSWPCDVAISPDAQYVVTGDTDDVVYFYDVYGTQIWTYVAGNWVTAVSVSSGGEYTAAGSWDNSLYFFNKTGNLLWSHEFEYNVDAVSVSPEGQYVAAGSPVFLFDKNGTLLLETAFYSSIKAVSLSANAERIAVGTYKKVTVIDKTANIIFERETDDSIKDVAITADGKFVAFGCGDYVCFLEALPQGTITCEVSSSEIDFGEYITVSGYVSPPHAGAEVTLTYTKPDGSSLTRTTTTNQTGFYSDTFTPETVGVWTVKASWMGDEQHAGSESSSQLFTVGKSEITCDVSPPVTFLGDSVTINGSISPPISSVQVTLEYKLVLHDSSWNPEGFINVSKTVMTLADGSFTDIFTPSEAGRWKINASWAGDAEHMASETETYFGVNPATEISLLSATPVKLYWHREQWYCRQRFPSWPFPVYTRHYFMDMETPTSIESEKIAFDPGKFDWSGHPHEGYWGIHTGRLSASMLVEEGFWNLSIWASACESNQHFIVRLCYWDKNHGYNFIASWNLEHFNSTSPETPTEFTHSFDLTAKIIPKGSCLGFVVAVGPDSNVNLFFDSTLHSSHLTIPPSTEMIDYDLTIMSTNGGTTTPSPDTYTYVEGTEVTVTAIPEAGYSFDHWELDEVSIGSDNPVNVVMDNNHTLLAVFIDDIPPGIGDPIQDPSENIQPGQNVTVTVTVTDLGMGVYNVTLWYSVDNGTTWTPSNMIENEVNTYRTQLQGYENCTWVRYKITAYDNAGNHAVNDNEGCCYVYQVIPEFSSLVILPLFMIATLLAAIAYRKKQGVE